ncbi:hypothetical protein HPL003_23225 [Paenibacillus terrae HPL-003]|uniref:Uncharacterized protein n=1 Tax=Paenibacillus terrae (strain HPL-003) TaxID=985665 RepID=G7VRI6_PAETH|nr:hypothetical protein HPL003_23225 [Paenibacillus terrae HPL-003]
MSDNYSQVIMELSYRSISAPDKQASILCSGSGNAGSN